MIYIESINNENSVYIKVNGYLSSNDIKNFINEYKQKIRGIKTTKCNLIIEVDPFQYDKVSEVKNMCIMFYKTGYKKIYLIDPNNYIMSNIKLNSLEKKMFLNAIKIIDSKFDIK